MAQQADILPGTLDRLILKAVSLGELHGYGVLLRIHQISNGALLIEPMRAASRGVTWNCAATSCRCETS